ncbi:urea ABC transporter permease subunit UrtB [Cellulomonas sp. URHD0024]|uniref:urea ABC transporter permease subunit UrtB n=1 Tax=Cellulomonas sp. URHD0024 TaxID=1302620 RepID=UPI00040AD4B6|nr:urea ABC transporter permease subunit UrtB [Cellulomonas sp. URHD0024]
MDALIAPLLNGSAAGALLLLAALGLTLTFGQMGVINMAHGDFIMAGAFIAYLTQLVITSSNISIPVALPLAFLGAGLLGLLLEVGIIQWMYKRPLDTLLVTVGVSLILQQIALQIFPAQGVPVEKPSWLDGQLDVLGYEWPLRQVFTIVLAILCVTALAAWLRYTSFGRRIRATVQNRDLAETSGVNTRTVDRITFFVGSGLAGVAGVAASLIGGTNSQMGTRYIIPAFLVVVAGGIGQIKGTVIAAWGVGVSLAFFADWTTGSMAQVLTFVLVVVFLQFRPQGLFTVRTRGLT